MSRSIHVSGDPAHGLMAAPGQEVLRLGVLEERVALAVQVALALGDQRRNPVVCALVQPPGQTDERAHVRAAANRANLDRRQSAPRPEAPSPAAFPCSRCLVPRSLPRSRKSDVAKTTRVVVKAETSEQPELDDWREAVRYLAAFERPSASEGERRAAEWIAERLRAHGAQASVEEEQAHGGYWWPITLPNLLAAGFGGRALRRPGRIRRIVAAAVAATGAAALWDDLGHGRRWFRRALLPHRSTWNVVAEMGDPRAPRTVALVAHHDAAHSGLVFHPALGEIGPRLFPEHHERAKQTLPILYGVWLGPVITALGAAARARRRCSRPASPFRLGASAAMAGHRPSRGGARSQRQPERRRACCSRVGRVAGRRAVPGSGCC